MPVHRVEIEEVPQAEEAEISKSKIKTMFSCFFGIRGIIDLEIVKVLKRLIDAVRHKRGELRRDC
jgi:hypothetical protein